MEFCLNGRLGLLLRADCGEPVLGDAQRERSLAVIAPPDRQGALRRNFFDQVLAQQLAEHLEGRAALELGANFNGAVLTLRGPRKAAPTGYR